MMPLSELAGLAAELDQQGRSRTADAVAAAWDVPAGTARFWRSSGSHVFAVPGAYLRFVPVGQRRFAAVAKLMSHYAEGVAQPLPSRYGRLVETVTTPRGEMQAMLVAEAPGKPIDVDEMTPAQAAEWGAALRRLHDGAPPAADLPELFPDLFPELRLPKERYGVLHGDFELDNIAWQAGRPTAYDFDDASRGWFAADVAYALRDVPAGSPVARAFCAGYRLEEADEKLLPLFARAHAAAWLARLPRILDLAPTAAEPSWLSKLRTKLHRYGESQRNIVRGDP